MKQLTSFLLFICGFITVYGDDHGTAPLYTKADFDDKIKADPHFVMFFAPW